MLAPNLEPCISSHTSFHRLGKKEQKAPSLSFAISTMLLRYKYVARRKALVKAFITVWLPDQTDQTRVFSSRF